MRITLYTFMIATLLLAGCMAKEREVSFTVAELDNIFSVNDLSEKWKLTSTTENFWGTGSGYEVSFLQLTESIPTYHGSSFYLILFPTANHAKQAFDNYQAAFFGDVWKQPQDIVENVEITFLDNESTRFRLECDPVSINDRWEGVDICIYWAQYENCLIIFNSHVRSPETTYEEYLSKLVLIDNRMLNTANTLCYPVD